MKFIKDKRLIAAAVLVLILIFLYVYNQNKSGNPVLPGQKPNVAAQEQNLIQKVGNLILLPANETPQIATVSDKTKLPNESFFAQAQNGDKVLIFNIAQEAILYRPSINKIISVAPINVVQNPSNQNPQVIQASPSATETPTQEISPTTEITPQSQ